MSLKRNIAVIVAHPDDETLWCGGEILMNQDDSWFIACMCRESDVDRAARFKKGYLAYKAKGAMRDLDDSPHQRPLPPEEVEEAIVDILRDEVYDLIITHSPFGEYTRHLRHEEVGRAVISLWSKQQLACKALWLFAYEDGDRAYYPRAIEHADFCKELPGDIWKRKYEFITEIYGFHESSFEAKTTPKKEAFWQFDSPKAAQQWMDENS